ncbi:quercetin dioxygenase-like cupin family protein [Bradyrhizobium sp. AZCC 2262]|uniref:cupin domain-containing protein n=1 Tax=Bradyrhizobium sp. AZCC 2262 TaxID=3117022 RepID=UPI002FEF502C
MPNNRNAQIPTMAPNSLPIAAVTSAASGVLAAILFATFLGPAPSTSASLLLPKFLYATFADLCSSQTDRSYTMESAAERPGAVAEVISTEKLSHVPGKNISLVRVKFPPGGWSPKHYHGGSVTVHVLSGTIRSQIEGTPAATYGPGETFFEPLGAIHIFAENVSRTDSAEVLAVFVHDEGATLTTHF